MKRNIKNNFIKLLIKSFNKIEKYNGIILNIKRSNNILIYKIKIKIFNNYLILIFNNKQNKYFISL
ncbi:hypothetical protein ACT2CR_00245 [Candidatus Vidania fulgoroideorum]